MEYGSCQINLISFFWMTTLVDKCGWNRLHCDIAYGKRECWVVQLAQVMQSWPADWGMWGFSWRAQQVLVGVSVVLSALLVIWKWTFSCGWLALWVEQRWVQSKRGRFMGWSGRAVRRDVLRRSSLMWPWAGRVESGLCLQSWVQYPGRYQPCAGKDLIFLSASSQHDATMRKARLVLE